MTNRYEIAIRALFGRVLVSCSIALIVGCANQISNESLVESLGAMVDIDNSYRCGPEDACVCTQMSPNVADIELRYSLHRICPGQATDEALIETFRPDGSIVDSLPVKDRYWHGEGRSFYPDGSLAGLMRFRMGCAHGLKESFHSNGAKFDVEEYDAGVEVGNWSRWDEDGNLVYTMEYEKGNLTRLVFRNEHGEMVEKRIPNSSKPSPPLTLCFGPQYLKDRARMWGFEDGKYA